MKVGQHPPVMLSRIVPTRVGKCHIRRATRADWPELERIYLAHEGGLIPPGYFAEFQDSLANPANLYFVATVDDRIIGSGGIGGHDDGDQQATLLFGIVDPAQCRRGYGTAILLARLLHVSDGDRACRVHLSATFWSAPYFARLGFKWHANETDDAGNHFLYGSHVILPGDDRIFRQRLAEGSVTLDL